MSLKGAVAVVRVAFAIAWAAVATAAPLMAQTLEEVFECAADLQLRAVADFSPPPAGPVSYQWRDGTGRVMGNDLVLDLGALKLPLGTHEITLLARGDGDQAPTTSLRATITDTTPPFITIEDPTITLNADATDPTTAAGIRVTDSCDSSPIVVASPRGPYRSGNTIVTLTARDASGNVAERKIVVRVARPAARRAPIARVEQAPAPVEVAPAVPVAPIVAPPQGAPPLTARPYSWWWLLLLLLLLLAAAIGKKWLAGSELHVRPTVDPGTQRIRWKDSPALSTKRRMPRP